MKKFINIIILAHVSVSNCFSSVTNSVPISTSTSSPRTSSFSSSTNNLIGNWKDGKESLQRDDCCVVSINGMESHLNHLYEYFVNQGPSDLDLRTRIHAETLFNDCLTIRQSVVSIPEFDMKEKESDEIDSCTAALMEFARGVISFADGLVLKKPCTDVYMRIVCASDYKAIDPMYHTDKAPLRGYTTLIGPGTEFCENICSPLEYASLRSLGNESSSSIPTRKAKNMEFIVMKGDYYEYNDPDTSETSKILSRIKKRIWTRTSACVHRSPPGNGGRRVIISLDLADGDDDREWYQKNQKREWRSGMTQRKSRLVA